VTALDVAHLYAEAFGAGLRPDPEITVDAWADEHRYLSPGEANEHGKYETRRVPFLREPMRMLSAHEPNESVTIMKSAQIGVTQVAVNWVGYIIQHAPAPTLFYLPTREVAQQISQTRIDPMFDATLSLRDRVSPNRSRDKRNTTFRKAFLGGELLLRGANSAAAFRNISARNVILDDLDGWPGEVGTEGDPVELIQKRAITFPNRKFLYVSTPTNRGISKIERLYNDGDQRRFYIPCTHCGHPDYLTWQGYRDHVVKKDPGHHRIEWKGDDYATAAMVCGECGKRSPEEAKTEMFIAGEWRPLAPGPGRQPSFHISGLYSPHGWASWAAQAAKFSKTKGNPLQLKAFVNLDLAETYEQRGLGAEADTVLHRLEVYGAQVPDGVGILVAAIDVQGDRLEILVIGFGAGLESWVIHWEAIPGDPTLDPVWFEAAEFLRRTWRHVSGRELKIECTAVDTHPHAEQVYKFCALHRARHVYAVRGGTLTGRPIVERPTRNNPYRIPLYTLCTDSAKEQIYGRLQIPLPAPGERAPGCMHFPAVHWLDKEYAEQLAAEKGEWKYVKGKGNVRRWLKQRDRNEILDLTVYCLAAVLIRGQSVINGLARRAARFSERVPGPAAAAPALAPAGSTGAPARAPRAPRPLGWVRGWRR
jgi:phage terminase large subunit GpA-like protein